MAQGLEVAVQAKEVSKRVAEEASACEMVK